MELTQNNLQAPIFLNGVCRHEHSSWEFDSSDLFLNGVCRHEPPTWHVLGI